jgi:hypothetical protein
MHTTNYSKTGNKPPHSIFPTPLLQPTATKHPLPSSPPKLSGSSGRSSSSNSSNSSSSFDCVVLLYNSQHNNIQITKPMLLH